MTENNFVFCCVLIIHDSNSLKSMKVEVPRQAHDDSGVENLKARDLGLSVLIAGELCISNFDSSASISFNCLSLSTVC